MSVPDLIAELRLARLDLSTEKATQADLAACLAGQGVEFEREHRLSSSDIPDFFLPAFGLAIEVKLRGASKPNVWRQIERYARHDTVSSLALVSNLSMGLPAESHGKPLYFVSLGRAWL